MEGATNKSEYDLNSAITFLLVGLGKHSGHWLTGHVLVIGYRVY